MAGTFEAKETAKLGVGREGVQAPTLLANSLHGQSNKERVSARRHEEKERIERWSATQHQLGNAGQNWRSLHSGRNAFTEAGTGMPTAG